MTAATADRQHVQYRDGGVPPRVIGFGVKGTTQIYKWTLVGVNSVGFLIPAADAASVKVVGFAMENVLGTTDGAKLCRVISGVSVKMAFTSITQAMVGTLMYVVDDSTADDATGTNSIKAGLLEEYISATSGWLWVPHGGSKHLL